MLLGVLCLATGGATAATVELQVLATTDIHGYLERTNRDGFDGGGWLRLATLMEARRQAAGAGHTLMIDCGDTGQGTLVAQLSKGECATDLLQALRYDAWVPGNHDFDFGVVAALRSWQAMGQRQLSGNLLFTRNGREEQPPAWHLFERGGARVAVIGATANYLEQWLWGRQADGFRATTAEALLERVMPEVHKARPDMIVLAIHQGWLVQDARAVNEIPQLVARFPEIDLILGGHTHRDIPGTKLGARTWYVQPGFDASSFAVVRATVDTEAHAVTAIQSELVTAAATVPFHPEAARVAASWLKREAEAGAAVLGTLAAPVSAAGEPGEGCQVSELFCAALAEATGAAVAFHNKLDPKAGLAEGTVTLGQLFPVVPFENGVATAELTAAELAEIVAEQWAQRGTPAYNGIWGLKVAIGTDGRVVKLAYPDGREVPAETRLKTVFNSYLVAGGGGRFPKLRALVRGSDARLHDTGLNSRDALAAYLAKHPGLRLTARSWIQAERK